MLVARCGNTAAHRPPMSLAIWNRPAHNNRGAFATEERQCTPNPPCQIQQCAAGDPQVVQPPPMANGVPGQTVPHRPRILVAHWLVQLCRVPSVEIDRGENGRNILGQVRPPAGRIGGVMARVHWSLRFPTLQRRRGHLTKRWRKEKEPMQT